MAELKGWKYFNFKRWSLCSTKSILVKVAAHLRFKPKRGYRNELLDLYKDMESCGEYEDIRVMLRMIQSSSSSPYANIAKRNNRSSSYRLLCFRPA